MKIRCDNTHSTFPLNLKEEGVPQESIISPTSFTIKINSMIDALSKGIEKSLYVDDLAKVFRLSDLAVFCQSITMTITGRRLQDFLDKLVTCADDNSFKESSSCKTRMPGTVKCRPTVAYRVQIDGIIIATEMITRYYSNETLIQCCFNVKPNPTLNQH